jgi:dTDP-glucose 4,6-dehydratase
VHLLVPGGAGFIGSNFVHMVVRERPDWRVTVLDALTYAGNLENLAPVENNPTYRFVKGDVCDRDLVFSLFAEGVDVMVNFATETHVDRSIHDASPFVRTNVVGAQVLLDAAREHPVGKFIQVSTDEVYGALGPDDPPFTPDTPLAPRNPYAATKAAADLLCESYAHTHGLPLVITRCSNNYGPYQYPEKLIPLMVSNAMADVPLPVYGDGMQVRDWIHVDDHNRALLAIIESGDTHGVYTIGAYGEKPNIEIVRTILKHLDKPDTLIEHVTDRPGHDRRYAIDPSRIEVELGWRAQVGLDSGLAETIRWYTDNRGWWERIKSGEFRTYYERHYGDR